MYFLYLDESGDFNNWKVNRNFVIAGVAIHEGQIEKYSHELEELQIEFFPGLRIMVPFHGSQIYAGKEFFSGIATENRMELLDRLYGVIGNSQFPHLLLFGTVLDITRAESPAKDLNTVFSDIMIRFNSFLNRQFDVKKPNKGLIVIDQAHEERYRELFHEFRNQGTSYGSIRNIVDIPYFARSKDTRMLQLADLVAYSLFRLYQNDDSAFYNKIKHKFDRRDLTTQIDGLKHLISIPCKCEACSSR